MNPITKKLHFLLFCLIAYCVLPNASLAAVLDSNVIIDSSSYIVVGSRRVGRTVKEYTLKAVANNLSSTQYSNVTATLISVPSNVNIIDGTVTFGTVSGNSNVTSSDNLVIQINVRVATSLDDLIWRVEGDLPAPPPGSGGGGSSGADKVGIFMYVDGNGEIKGESKSSSHMDWIELLSFAESSSTSTLIGGVGGAAGKPNFENVSTSKFIDSSSVPLRLALAEGDIFNEIQIEIVKSCGGNLYVRYAITLTAPVITSISAGGSGGEDRLTENLSINYVRIETMYTPVGSDCKLEAPLFSFYDKRGL